MKRMRYRVTIKRENSADGADVPTYDNYMQAVPCDIQPVKNIASGRGEQLYARQIQATSTHLISMRFVSGILPTMKLVDDHSAVEYFIERIVKRDGRDHMLDIQCREVVL